MNTVSLRSLAFAFGALTLGACASSSAPAGSTSMMAPARDPRVGLRAGMWDAAQATWNMRLVSNARPSAQFDGVTNSDLAFSGNYVLQGNYNGFQVWDVSNPAAPSLKIGYLCPASQSDVSVYKNLLFVSGEGNSGRLDCGSQGVSVPVSHDRLRGIRIFDITDITAPKYLGNVQTCRGSHTHTVLESPNDPNNVYIYVSGSAGVRAPEELPGCSRLAPDQDPNSALFRIEVIKVPLAHPELAAIVSQPRIFNDLVAPPEHGEAKEDIEENAREVRAAKARGGFTANIFGMERVLPPGFVAPMLDSVMKARGGAGVPTAADSAALRANIQKMMDARFGTATPAPTGPRPGPSQCHDITVYPAVGLAGGACGGYGLLLDIRDPANPRRIAAVADSNFSYWHSATFSNDGSKVLFSDEWGGGGGPKCRATDKPEWGANAIFTINNGQMTFQSYYKLPAAQTRFENCVAHNGSLIPVPGREIMVQAWYQGGISVFDWTDPAHPKEIAFFDRGPVDSTRMGNGGAWSSYWYNGYIYSSEIGRGLDVLELTPNAWLTQNEIDAAKLVHLDYLNVQGQQKMVWPAHVAVVRAYLDQLERGRGMSADKIRSTRAAIDAADRLMGDARKSAFATLATQLHTDARSAADPNRAHAMASAVGALGGM